jgi:hypothetical protein
VVELEAMPICGEELISGFGIGNGIIGEYQYGKIKRSQSRSRKQSYFKRP